jgi:hypothetical protein
MKRFILTVIFTIISLFSFSQVIDYPRYEVDSLGQKVVVLTIAQATELDNNSELLGLFEKLNAQIGEYDSACIKVINEKDKVIAIQKIEIAKLKESLSVKDEQIVALQKTIEEYQSTVAIMGAQLKAKDKIIDEKNRQIRKLRFKTFMGGIGGSLAIVGLLVAFVLIN